MIQRIQSLYLFIAAALMAVLFFVPLANLYGEGLHIQLTVWGIKGVPLQDGPFALVDVLENLGFLLLLCSVLPLVALFLFKKRQLQIRLCYVEMGLLVAMQLLVGFRLWSFRSLGESFQNSSVVFSVADILPLVCLILTWLAVRAIKKDEALVRSLDRIR